MKHCEPHIIYIITKLELGGAQKVCLSLFESNRSATLITGAEGPLIPRVANNPNVILIKELTREVRFFGFINELHCFLKLVLTLRRLKKKYPHAIVHTHSTKAGILGRWAAFFAGIRTRIHTIHGYAFHNHQNKVAWLLIYATELITSFITTRFVCVSYADVKTGIRLFPWFANKHSIIRAAVEYTSFVPACRTILRQGPSLDSGRTAERFILDSEKIVGKNYSSFRPDASTSSAERQSLDSFVSKQACPEFIEGIEGHSFKNYLLPDFLPDFFLPDFFWGATGATLFFSIEACKDSFPKTCL